MTIRAVFSQRIKEQVQHIFEASTTLDTMCVRALESGATYQEVADVLGITRQACWALYHEEL